MYGQARGIAGLHPLTPPATMKRDQTLVDVPPEETPRPPRNLVLCFDGTGNQYKGDGTETNILKIFGLLDRGAPDQYHYYQPGIGTYAVRSALARTDWLVKMRSEVEKGIDLMFGKSLSEHVLSGYKFLMRYYAPGDQIYIFGFSRGAYTARFLAEMLDDVGLLPHGNEEMVEFAWEVFSEWQCRKPFGDKKPGDGPQDARNRKNYDKAKKLGAKVKGFRKNFSRQLDPIRFLGLFDTVNSVPQFETPFFGRASSKTALPYSARSSAREIWHAVSIDERRVKFRPDLVYQAKPPSEKDKCQLAGPPPVERAAEADREEDFDMTSPTSPTSPEQIEARSHDTTKFGQQVHEVWFAGNHCDVGGGWPDPADERVMNMAHVPLVWMVRAAQRAGVKFDAKRLARAKIAVHNHHQPTPNNPMGLNLHPATKADLHDRYTRMHQEPVHDVLKLEKLKYLWMEYCPFKRMDMDPNTGYWRPIRCPVPRGEGRDVPLQMRVHGSVIDRMKANPDYRPQNLIVGAGRNDSRGRWFGRRRGSDKPFVEDEWVVFDDPDAHLGDDEYGVVCVRRSQLKDAAAHAEEANAAAAAAAKGEKVMVGETEVAAADDDGVENGKKAGEK
ncbi:hypothetical protein B0H66DRAFT_596078 [Apodospora peruviana]|uniref:T6SS Phospholipase effector Tle1-like catalytic domain-containing protein n=1 Tax=Apodospora peruviana TaxID=516989 RepID=A0AAE0HTF4_9PEZI|nr:hypothetical protein B0H66DRAFT_596078 [Apodospora peruviana]